MRFGLRNGCKRKSTKRERRKEVWLVNCHKIAGESERETRREAVAYTYFLGSGVERCVHGDSAATGRADNCRAACPGCP